MKKDKYRSHNEKTRSYMEKGDYRSAQKESANFLIDLIKDGINGIGNIFKNRREAKERERERLERERIEREKAERRKKILKTIIIIIIIGGIGTGGFFLVRKIFFGNNNVILENSTDVEVPIINNEKKKMEDWPDKRLASIAQNKQALPAGMAAMQILKERGYTASDIANM